MPPLSPGARLLAAAALCLFACLVAVATALDQPFLGLVLEPTDGKVRVAASEGPAGAIPAGSTLVAVGEDDAIRLEPTDLAEDPDAFDEFADMRAFFARQSVLARALRAERVPLAIVRPDGSADVVVVRPGASRPLASLPLVFWFQLAVGSAGLFMGVWVWALRPRDLAAALFAGLGVTFPAFTVPAAVYSTRELALDGALFTGLSAVNQTGAVLFGCALVALFLAYPRRLVPPRFLLVVPAVYVPWLVLAVLQVVPDQNTGSRLAVLTEMLLAIVLGFVQARATRGDPRDRAALRWLGLSILVGSGLFVFTSVATRIFGWFPPLRQGYAFGFFLLMDVGLALGLRRYRLFELDEWAYRVLFWVGGALLLLAFDAMALFLLDLDATSSLGLALLVSSFVYLPLRGWLLARLVTRRDLDQPALFQSLLEVAFGVTDTERSDRWVALVRRLFDPLVLEPAAAAAPAGGARLEGDGLALFLPGVASTPALRIEHPWKGRALFGPRHLRLAESIVSILRHAEASRGAYDRGVREERLRIARDLHDDVGARLLSGLHEGDLGRAREAMRHAIADMRSIVTALTGTSTPVDEVLADLRHEADGRLASAGLELEWPLPEPAPGAVFGAAVGRHFVSMFREVISNAIRHAGARRIEVAIAIDGGFLTASIHDDGAGLRDESGEGHGLENLRLRATEAGGEVSITASGEGTTLALRLPIEVRA